MGLVHVDLHVPADNALRSVLSAEWGVTHLHHYMDMGLLGCKFHSKLGNQWNKLETR